ncbi:sensor histidine kinase [Cerasicoccus fimbriatus]|uniref:sensor histidine kinase n=1 Tax=Cerasicoccus fimbriatus TaxID=3014554 RepID=UPI0022B41026|nr:ATP-binding protein [Cerasicoccus sp. TK19100]
MITFLCIFFAATAAFFYLRHRKVRNILRTMVAAVEERRAYLFEEDAGWVKDMGLCRLALQLNELLAEHERSSKQELGYLRQIETTLSNLTEAVLIVDDRSLLVMANSAARELLGLGPDCEGRRLEGVLKSAGFLEFMELAEEGSAPAWQEIEIVRGRDSLFVEVTGARIPESDSEGRPLTLFVLHDISRLKKLENVRRDFVANVSHELRTPVTVIKGFTDTLIEDHEHLKSEEQIRFLQKIYKNVERLHLLLEDLLTLSRLEGEAINLNRQPCSLRKLIHDITENFLPRLNLDEQTLVCDLDPELDIVNVDQIKMSQVLQNTLDNALRYAKGFSRIIVRTSRDGNYFLIEVEDDGCGIPEKDMAHIFERFYRVDKGRSRELGGTGLGLSIVKHVVQLHGGTVAARNVSGGGLCITCRIPIKPPAIKGHLGLVGESVAQ